MIFRPMLKKNEELGLITVVTANCRNTLFANFFLDNFRYWIKIWLTHREQTLFSQQLQIAFELFWDVGIGWCGASLTVVLNRVHWSNSFFTFDVLSPVNVNGIIIQSRWLLWLRVGGVCSGGCVQIWWGSMNKDGRLLGHHHIGLNFFWIPCTVISPSEKDRICLFFAWNFCLSVFLENYGRWNSKFCENEQNFAVNLGSSPFVPFLFVDFAIQSGV